MEKKSCIRCGEEFFTRNDSNLCFSCTLSDLTGGFPPEEGDFNTAKIQSGTMTDEDYAYLQEDLASVEEGRSIDEPEEIEEWDDHSWCDVCNKDIAFCECICHVCGRPVEECDCDCDCE